MTKNLKEQSKLKKKKEVKVTISDKRTVFVGRGTTIAEVVREDLEKCIYPPVIAKINNKLADFECPILKDSTIELVDLTNSDGKLCYQRSLSFLLCAVVKSLFGKANIKIKHSLCKGFYCEIEFDPPRQLTNKDVLQIQAKMLELIKMDLPFKRNETNINEAIKFFEEQGQNDKARLFKYRMSQGNGTVSIYECAGYKNHFYGYLVPSTRYLKTFELRFYPPGFLIRFPRKSNPDAIPDFIEQVKLFTIYQEYGNWGKILGVQSAADLNDKIETGGIDEFILIAEALQDKKTAEIADMIKSRIVKPRLILISGPSSSGKTTFSKRLAIQLRVIGLKAIPISLDNYFVDRELTPKDEWGEYDFESVDAINQKLFNENIMALLAGESVKLPKYDFKSGTSKLGKAISIRDNNILIVEGIHGLNRQLTESIPDAIKFKIYVSPLTMLNLDCHNRISTTDSRLLRRIVRDNFYRGYSALATIRRWESVNKGEEKYIFPYQERADVMFNSSLVYEIAVLKKFAEPQLTQITPDNPEFSMAARLLKFLSHFREINSHNVPKTSILREFIGGSAFNY